MSKLKSGHVISLRVNPTDCMSVVDVVRKAGVYTPGMSFSMMVSLALSSVLQTLRDCEVIPERDGYEFNELMGPHLGKQNKRKYEVTQTIKSIGSDLHVRGLSKPRQEIPQESRGEYIEPELTAEQRRIWSRLGELQAKMDLAEQEGSGVVFSAGDMQEFNHLNTLV